MPKTRATRARVRQTSLFDVEPSAPAERGEVRATPEVAPPRSKGKKVKASESRPRARRAAVPAAERAGGPRRREDAASMASKQREISISEFFTKNRHLLGFDNPQKALLTAVKEAVDNSLDACEEAGILPDLIVEITEVGENRFRIAVEDNGPGIVRQQIPKIFGKLLYGSKFHRLKQQRGQQGIGISAAGMYGQLTTGRPVSIISRTGKGSPAHHFQLVIDTKKNAPVVQKDTTVEWDKAHGTRVEIDLEAIYKKGRRSVDDYVEQTALANPHASIRFVTPQDEPRVYERVTRELPKESSEIKPHPHGVELGILMRMLKDSGSRNLRGALTGDFSRVSATVAERICEAAGVSPSSHPSRLTSAQVELLFHAIPKVKIMAPPTTILSPIGEELLERGLSKRVDAEFSTAITRPPSVYRGNPFQIEAGFAYGGSLPADDLAQLYRFANRVPLQYQQSACAIFKAALSVDWRNYGLQQSRGALPTGPLVISVHVASVWVPFTSESKEAVASYPEILKEIRLALMEAGRRLGAFVRRRRRMADEAKKRAHIERYIPTIGRALQQILGLSDRERDAAIVNLKSILERSRKA
jgi:DNA topoisomerase-6 subunit B